jgi:hypothetical protein
MNQTTTSIQNLSFCLYRYENITDKILQDCAILFSQHYGIWSKYGPRPRQSISLSIKQLKKQYLWNPEKCFLITAYNMDKILVGHLFGCNFIWPVPLEQSTDCKTIWPVPIEQPIEQYKKASWITQLVVHEKYRSNGIATRLCRLVCENSIACGLASSHPFAVRALESASEQLCLPQLIKKHANDLAIASGVPYLQGYELKVTEHQSIIDTKFFVEHNIVNSLVVNDCLWSLGLLEEGEEFFAFVNTKDSDNF